MKVKRWFYRLGRLSADYYDSLHAVFAAESSQTLVKAYSQSLNVIKHSAQRETAAVLSTEKFRPGARDHEDQARSIESIKTMSLLFSQHVDQCYKKICQEKKLKSQPITLTEEEKKLNRIIPVRAENFVCPLQMEYLEEKLGKDALADIRLQGYTAYEALNYVDSIQSVYAISQAVSAEYGPMDVRDFYNFFKALEKAELISFKIK